MFLAQVLGSVVSTVKHQSYDGTKLMVVQPVSPGGTATEDSLLAVDTVGAGPGETVLVLRQGVAAAQVLGIDRPPIRSVIVGIVDPVDTPN
ncbi:MAG: EutN/CcmL family microcompartment protein [Candidatus Latescibacteria bacterium]|nr:EutN/CcmL family microcompartment protein [Candidatus Latescibacterota bacterium]